jgi:steroid delta-isomerase
MPAEQEMTRAVHDYVTAFDKKDPELAVALFAENGTVEDPVGAQIIKGRAAIRDFYTRAMEGGAKLRLEGAVRARGNHAAFAFTALFDPAGEKRIEIIDTFRFDDQGKVVEMRAFWGPGNMHGFKANEPAPMKKAVSS